MFKTTLISKKLSIILSTVTLLLTSSICFAATYYIDATNGNDDSDGQSISTAWKTIEKINTSSFNPGDQILFSRGEIWREKLSPPSSGAPGIPIIFSVYGSGNAPVICGADLVSEWQATVYYNLYVSNCTWSPNQVFEDDVRLNYITWDTDIQTTSASMVAGSWTIDYSGNKLYVWTSDGADPNTHTIAASNRIYCIYGASEKDYITINGLTVRYANGNGIDTNGGNNWIIDNSTARGHWYYGMKASGGSLNVIIEDSTATDNYYGVGANQATSLTVSRCASYYNKHRIDSDGMQFNNVATLIVEENEIYGNTNGGSSDGLQINHCSNATVRYNYLYDNGNSSIIFTGGDSYGSIYRNVIVGSNNGINLRIGGGNTFVYNNSIYNTKLRIAIVTHPHTVVIENNAIHGGAGYALYEESSVDDSLVTLDYNCLYNIGGNNMIYFEQNAYTQAQFSNYQLSEVQDINSISKDPLFTDVFNGNHTLLSVSPMINAGTILKATFNRGLHKSSSWPGNVVTKTENDFGIGWEIGAFVFESNIHPPTNVHVKNE